MEFTENALKEILAEQREEFQRFNDTQKKEFFHFMGIMKEDIQSNIQLIAEQYQNIKDDLSIIKTDVHYVKSALKKKVDYDEFESLEKRVLLLESRAKK
jgi:hypothetical protein